MTKDEAIATAQSLLNGADSYGFDEIGGWFLNSQESLIAQQQKWDDEDGAKDFDFTTSPYWLHDDEGSIIAISDAADLVDTLPLHFPWVD